MALNRHIHVLKQLCKPDIKRRRRLLKEGGKPLQVCLRECALNVVKGNVPLSKRQFKKLKPYRNTIRQLSKYRTSLKDRLKIEQRGGFLGSLLVPILASIAGAVIKRVRK